MKIPALLTVVALTCGAAFAQTTDSTAATTTDQGIARGNRVDGTLAKSRSDGKMMGNTATASKDAGMSQPTTMASGDTMSSKAKSGTHKAKKVAKKTTHKAKHVAAADDTRSMGAPSSDMNSSDRKSRMDAAYANWQAKKK